MKYYYSFDVEYQEVDASRKIRLYSLENHLLTIAGQVADDLGFGIKYLYPQNLTWILVRMSLEMNYMPTHNDHIEVETWVEGHVHSLSIRDYRLYLVEGASRREIGRCKSVWAVLDLTKREIAHVFDQPVFADCVDGEVLPIDKAPKLLPIKEPTDVVPHTIQYSDCDYNGHCNSCKYLEWMLNAYLPEWVHTALRLDINYSKELHLGEAMQTAYLVTDNEVQYRQTDASSMPSVTARIARLV